MTKYYFKEWPINYMFFIKKISYFLPRGFWLHPDLDLYKLANKNGDKLIPILVANPSKATIFSQKNALFGKRFLNLK